MITLYITPWYPSVVWKFDIWTRERTLTSDDTIISLAFSSIVMYLPGQPRWQDWFLLVATVAIYISAIFWCLSFHHFSLITFFHPSFLIWSLYLMICLSTYIHLFLKWPDRKKKIVHNTFNIWSQAITAKTVLHSPVHSWLHTKCSLEFASI